MPKGTRKSQDPVKKLLVQVSQMSNTVQAILESAEKPDLGCQNRF
jgi:hypothetical protein